MLLLLLLLLLLLRRRVGGGVRGRVRCCLPILLGPALLLAVARPLRIVPRVLRPVLCVRAPLGRGLPLLGRRRRIARVGAAVGLSPIRRGDRGGCNRRLAGLASLARVRGGPLPAGAGVRPGRLVLAAAAAAAAAGVRAPLPIDRARLRALRAVRPLPAAGLPAAAAVVPGDLFAELLQRRVVPHRALLRRGRGNHGSRRRLRGATGARVRLAVGTPQRPGPARAAGCMRPAHRQEERRRRAPHHTHHTTRRRRRAPPERRGAHTGPQGQRSRTAPGYFSPSSSLAPDDLFIAAAPPLSFSSSETASGCTRTSYEL